MVDLSVLLVVRNWSTQRLALSLASLQTARSNINSEIILLDYGSDEVEPYQELAREFEAKYVRAEAAVWSRSRALNLAAASAEGRWFLFADADMLWSPRSLEKSLGRVREDPNQYVVFQARDLPQELDGDVLTARGYDWKELESNASWRPRWGMGMQLVARKHFHQVQGLDERMVLYGGEDNDMAKRLQHIGLTQHWVKDREVRVYHIWHPSSRQSAMLSTKGVAAIEMNREIRLRDESIIRNLPRWRNRPLDADPLVSVVIVTRDRQNYLREAIDSVLAQSFQDFELIVVDDGEEDGVQALTASYGDKRIRYVRSPERGIAASRNYAAEISHGHYTAIHDDDDLMLPWSLEGRLAAIRAGDVGAYGGSYHFDDDSGALKLSPGKNFSLEALYVAGKVFYHPTVLIETDVIRNVRYETTLRSGSDYNLFVRAAMAGYKLRHCGDVVLLKREHAHQVTETDSVIQKSSAVVTNGFTKLGQSLEQRTETRKAGLAVETFEYNPELIREGRFTPWLPSRLVDRVLIYRHETDADDLPSYLLAPHSYDIAVQSLSDSRRYTIFPRPEVTAVGELNEIARTNGTSTELTAALKSSSNQDLSSLAEANILRWHERDAEKLPSSYAREAQGTSILLTALRKSQVRSFMKNNDKASLVHSFNDGAMTLSDLYVSEEKSA